MAATKKSTSSRTQKSTSQKSRTPSKDRATTSEAASRFEAFEQVAQARARGEMVPLPRALTGHDRRVHVRQTLREDHQHRIATGSEEARDKFDKLIRDLLDDSLECRSEWLTKKYHDEYARGFKTSKKLVPQPRRVEEFQAVMDQVVKRAGIDVPARAGEMRVKYVAIRNGQGTASLGLVRYYVMIEGPTEGATDDVIIELKQARRSALAGLTPPSDFGVDGAGDRITDAARVQLVNGDAFFGHVDFEDMSFMTRERSPYKNEIELADLSKSEWRDYAGLCGQTLAHAHALSDDAGERTVDIEPLILQAAGPVDLFVDDILGFAVEAADRLRRDHAYFRADHRLGAFTRVDRAFL